MIAVDTNVPARFYCHDAADPEARRQHLMGMAHVTVERWEAVKDAIDLHRGGVDFADALHCTTSSGCEALVSLDKHLARISGKAGSPLPVKLPS